MAIGNDASDIFREAMLITSFSFETPQVVGTLIRIQQVE
jgi:hypothetical protein